MNRKQSSVFSVTTRSVEIKNLAPTFTFTFLFDEWWTLCCWHFHSIVFVDFDDVRLGGFFPVILMQGLSKWRDSNMLFDVESTIRDGIDGCDLTIGCLGTYWWKQSSSSPCDISLVEEEIWACFDQGNKKKKNV